MHLTNSKDLTFCLSHKRKATAKNRSWRSDLTPVLGNSEPRLRRRPRGGEQALNWLGWDCWDKQSAAPLRSRWLVPKGPAGISDSASAQRQRQRQREPCPPPRSNADSRNSTRRNRSENYRDGALRKRIKGPGRSGAMPLSAADNPSSLFLAKCGSTLFCISRSVLLWIVVFAVFLLGALRQRLVHFARRAPEQPKS